MSATEQPFAPRKNSSDSASWVDEVLRDLYASRDAYAEEHGNDVDRIFADLTRSVTADESTIIAAADPIRRSR